MLLPQGLFLFQRVVALNFIIFANNLVLLLGEKCFILFVLLATLATVMEDSQSGETAPSSIDRTWADKWTVAAQ